MLEYLRDIGDRVPPLTHAEEVAIFRRLCRAQTRAARCPHAATPCDACRAPVRDLMGQLLAQMYPFVASIARTYLRRGMCLDDLIGHGNVGLMIAVKKFEPRRGNKLITYAKYWIHQAIGRALEADYIVHIPTHIVQAIKRKQKAERMGRKATPEEIGETPALVEAGERVLTLGSLDTRSLADLLPGDDEDPAAQVADAEVMRARLELLAGLLAKLPERWRQLLVMRFGLGGTGVVPLREVGNRLGISKERVRQIEAEALARLAELLRRKRRWDRRTREVMAG